MKCRSRFTHELQETCVNGCVCYSVCASGAIQLALCSKHHSFSPTVAQKNTLHTFNNKET